MNCLAFIKQHYYISKKVGIDDKWFSKPLSRETLDLENSLFKLTMKNQTSKAMVEPKDKIQWLNCDVNLPQIELKLEVVILKHTCNCHMLPDPYHNCLLEAKKFYSYTFVEPTLIHIDAQAGATKDLYNFNILCLIYNYALAI